MNESQNTDQHGTMSTSTGYVVLPMHKAEKYTSAKTITAKL